MIDDKITFTTLNNNIFAKLSSNQKTTLVSRLHEKEDIFRFLRDGINNSGTINESDVEISVDTAVDISKKSTDIILLQKDLVTLEEGVIKGRGTFGNINKVY